MVALGAPVPGDKAAPTIHAPEDKAHGREGWPHRSVAPGDSPSQFPWLSDPFPAQQSQPLPKASLLESVAIFCPVPPALNLTKPLRTGLSPLPHPTPTPKCERGLWPLIYSSIRQ